MGKKADARRDKGGEERKLSEQGYKEGRKWNLKEE